MIEWIFGFFILRDIFSFNDIIFFSCCFQSAHWSNLRWAAIIRITSILLKLWFFASRRVDSRMSSIQMAGERFDFDAQQSFDKLEELLNALCSVTGLWFWAKDASDANWQAPIVEFTQPGFPKGIMMMPFLEWCDWKKKKLQTLILLELWILNDLTDSEAVDAKRSLIWIEKLAQEVVVDFGERNFGRKRNCS